MFHFLWFDSTKKIRKNIEKKVWKITMATIWELGQEKKAGSNSLFEI